MDFLYNYKEATTIWNKQHFDLDLDILQYFIEMLYIFNSYIELYKTANETLKDNAPTNSNLQIILNF